MACLALIRELRSRTRVAARVRLCVPEGSLMDRLERFFKIRNLLAARRHVTRDEFLQELEVSEATFKRDLEYLRDRLLEDPQIDLQENH
jgi:hypothetical protein